MTFKKGIWLVMAGIALGLTVLAFFIPPERMGHRWLAVITVVLIPHLYLALHTPIGRYGGIVQTLVFTPIWAIVLVGLGAIGYLKE